MIRPPDNTDRDLIVTVLRSASDLRMRAARAAAAEVNARAQADGARRAQPDALKVVRIMAEAARLGELADDLERTEVILAEREVLEARLAAVTRDGDQPAYLDDEARDGLVDLVREHMPRPDSSAAATRAGDATEAVLAALEQMAYLTRSRPTADAPPSPAPANVVPIRKPGAEPPAQQEPTPDAVDAATLAAEAILDSTFGPGDTIIEEGSDPLAERVILPAGQGNDDDPDPDVDVANLPGFDAATDDSALDLILEDQ